MPKRNYAKVLQIVKEYENVYIDTSTVPDYYEEEYPWKTSVNIIEECYRKVGSDKMMWASDYPGNVKERDFKSADPSGNRGVQKIFRNQPRKRSWQKMPEGWFF